MIYNEKEENFFDLKIPSMLVFKNEWQWASVPRKSQKFQNYDYFKYTLIIFTF